MADKQQSIHELPPFEHAPEVSLEREQPVEHPAIEAPVQSDEHVLDDVVPIASAPTQTPVILDEKSQMRRDIERILEEDLGDIYLTLNTKQRQQFRIEGERTAAKIELLLAQVKVKVRQIINIIAAWLLLLPGVNKFFLEQEAKIKAEKMIILKTEEESA
ncbi:MAG: hypothetical protein Q7S47_01860 [bacterium]|nr:hypothetical protein [bacterium]